MEIKKEVLKRNEKENNRTEQKAKRGQQHDQ